MEKAGHVVSRDELLRTVWGDTVVSDNVLKVCISELREALGDDSSKPRFIETLPKQGYRFIAPLSTALSVVSTQHSGVRSQESSSALQPASDIPPFLSTIRSPQSAISLVGRESELSLLNECWQRVMNGERQVVFVTGEPGIGKTALVDAFLMQVRPTPGVGISRGQCIEHYGAGEAYLPVLEAFEQSSRTPAREQMVALLNQYAPLWLAQMPALLSIGDRERLQRELQGVTQERMLREMATFLEALTSESPLLVVLEDLHWSDASTLALLSAVARRRQPARLLVIGTYRPSDIPDAYHPLVAMTQELRLHRQCYDVPVSLLTEEAVAAYLTERFSGHTVPEGLASAIHQQTEGNPLFMVNLVDHVLAQSGGPAQMVSRSSFTAALRSLPENLRQMAIYQIDRLSSNEQELLEAASVAGVEFSAETVAVALDRDEPAIERACDSLGQRHLMLRALRPPSGLEERRSSRYSFRHALFHQAFYERLGLARRRQLHQRIGEQKERVHGSRAGEISSELATHCTEGRDVARAVFYLQQAARTALRRSAHLEAKDHLTRALEWLSQLPDPAERVKRELELQLMLGVTLMSTQGFSSPQVQQTYAHARQLCQQLGSTPQIFPALWGLRSFYHVRAEYSTAREIAEQLLQLAESTQNTDLLVEGHLALGTTSVFQGDLFDARAHLEESLRVYDPQQHRSHAYAYGQDPAVLALCHLASLFAGMGHLDQAVSAIQRAVTIAEEIAHTFSLGYARCFAGAIHSARSEPEVTLQHSEQAIALAQAQGFPHFQVMGTLLYGWALAELGKPEEGTQHLQQALDAQKRIGFEVGRSFYLTLLADVYCQTGQREPGLAAVAEGIERVEQKGEWFYAAELYRLKGELALQKGVREEENQEARGKRQKAKE